MICPVDMNMYARFDEIPSITLKDIKKTKCYGRTDARTDARTDGWTDNVKTVYPPTNTVCGGYKKETNMIPLQKRLSSRSHTKGVQYNCFFLGLFFCLYDILNLFALLLTICDLVHGVEAVFYLCYAATGNLF